MSRDDRAAALEDLAEAIRDLSDAIDERSRDRSTTAPSLSDVLRVADEHAIPTLITLLEAQIRALEAMQRSSRLVRRGSRAQDRIRSSIGEGRTRRPDADSMVDQLGTTIDAIQRRLGDTDEETRALLDRTRSIYEEIDRTIAQQTDDTTGRADGYRIEINDGDAVGTDRSEAVDSREKPESTKSAGDHVDVDAELRTLKDQYGTGSKPESREKPGDTADRDQSAHPGQTDDPTVDGGSGADGRSAPENESATGNGAHDEGDSRDEDDPTDLDGPQTDGRDSGDQNPAASTTDEPDDVDQ